MIYPEEKFRGALSKIYGVGGRLLLPSVFVSESRSQIYRRNGPMHSQTVSERDVADELQGCTCHVSANA